MRVLKRYIARQIFRVLTAAHPTPAPQPDRHPPEHSPAGRRAPPGQALARPHLPTLAAEAPGSSAATGRRAAIAQQPLTTEKRPNTLRVVPPPAQVLTQHRSIN